jgi:hypothetical protein
VRQALNSNPMVQIAVVGVLIVIVGLFLMMNMKKKSPESEAAAPVPAASASSPAAGTTAPVVVPGTGASAAPSTGVAGATGGLSVTSGAVTQESLIPGPGLPAPLIKAWKGGDAIALLIVRGRGIDDKLVRGSVESLSSEGNVAVFVARAQDVARYSRITQGVGVSRAPALVVVRPRRNSGSVPQGTVSYGFRNSAGVVQALHNALYSGPDDLPYSTR